LQKKGRKEVDPEVGKYEKRVPDQGRAQLKQWGSNKQRRSVGGKK